MSPISSSNTNQLLHIPPDFKESERLILWRQYPGVKPGPSIIFQKQEPHVQILDPFIKCIFHNAIQNQQFTFPQAMLFNGRSVVPFSDEEAPAAFLHIFSNSLLEQIKAGDYVWGIEQIN